MKFYQVSLQEKIELPNDSIGELNDFFLNPIKNLGGKVFTFLSNEKLPNGEYLISTSNLSFQNLLSNRILAYPFYSNRTLNLLQLKERNFIVIDEENYLLGEYDFYGPLTEEVKTDLDVIHAQIIGRSYTTRNNEILSTNTGGPKENMRRGIDYLISKDLNGAVFDFYYALCLYVLRTSYGQIGYREFIKYLRYYPNSPLCRLVNNFIEVYNKKGFDSKGNKKIHVILGDWPNKINEVLSGLLSNREDIKIYPPPKTKDDFYKLKLKDENENPQHLVFFGHGHENESTIFFNIHDEFQDRYSIHFNELVEKAIKSNISWHSLINISCYAKNIKFEASDKLKYLIKHDHFFDINSVAQIFDFCLDDLGNYVRFENFFFHAQAISYIISPGAEALNLIPLELDDRIG